jgi:diguanylate cyclase (GGDEF)-like protein
MQKNKFDLQVFVGWREILALLIIVVALVAIFFTEQIEFKVIGIMLIILSIVGLILLVTAKISDFVEQPRPRPANTPKFTSTEKTTSQTRGRVIENFDSALTGTSVSDSMGLDPQIERDGFRIIRKIAKSQPAAQNTDLTAPTVNSVEPVTSNFKKDVLIVEYKEEPKVEETIDNIIENTEIVEEKVDEIELTPQEPSLFDDVSENLKFANQQVVESILQPQETDNDIIDTVEVIEITNQIVEKEIEEIYDDSSIDEIAEQNVSSSEMDILSIGNDEDIEINTTSEEPLKQREVAFKDSGIKLIIKTKEPIEKANTELEATPIITTNSEDNLIQEIVDISSNLEEANTIEQIQTNDVTEEVKEVESSQLDKVVDNIIEEKENIELVEEIVAEIQAPLESVVPILNSEEPAQLETIDEFDIVDEEPRKEFNFIITKILMAVLSVSNTKTATLLLVNNERKELILESYVTGNQDAIIQNRKIRFGSDIISRIASSGKPEIVSEIISSSELDLIPYYHKSCNTASFIGLPVYFEGKIIAVLTADSDEPDAYDELVLGFMGQFSKIISILIKNYNEKFDLIQNSRVLEYLKSFKDLSSSSSDLNDVVNSLFESIAKTIDCSTIGLVSYDGNNAWTVGKLSSIFDQNADLIGTSVDLNTSVVGLTVKECAIKIFNPIDSSVVRVTNNEMNLDNGFFASYPLIANNECFAALFIEGINSTQLTNEEIEIIDTLVSFANLTIEKLHYLELLKEGIVIDPNTGLLNLPAFSVRLKEEMYRAIEFEIDSSLLLIRLDKYSSFSYEEYPNRFKAIKKAFINLTESYLREFDLIGEFDNDTITVLLIGYDVEKSKIWAERLRRDVASKVVSVEDKTFNFTISIGLAELTSGTSVAQIINNADTALNSSVSKSNYVSIYS